MMRLLNEMERIRANIGECKYRQMQFARTPGVSHTPACIFSGIYGRMQFAGFFLANAIRWFFGRMQFVVFLGKCNSLVFLGECNSPVFWANAIRPYDLIKDFFGFYHASFVLHIVAKFNSSEVKCLK
jgi:hypothetical protein